MKVSCTTCRHKHDEDQRVDKPSRDHESCCFDSCCPHCGGRVYLGVLAKPKGKRIYANTSKEWRESYNNL